MPRCMSMLHVMRSSLALRRFRCYFDSSNDGLRKTSTRVQDVPPTLPGYPSRMSSFCKSCNGTPHKPGLPVEVFHRAEAHKEVIIVDDNEDNMVEKTSRNTAVMNKKPANVGRDASKASLHPVGIKSPKVHVVTGSPVVHKEAFSTCSANQESHNIKTPPARAMKVKYPDRVVMTDTKAISKSIVSSRNLGGTNRGAQRVLFDNSNTENKDPNEVPEDGDSAVSTAQLASSQVNRRLSMTPGRVVVNVPLDGCSQVSAAKQSHLVKEIEGLEFGQHRHNPHHPLDEPPEMLGSVVSFTQIRASAQQRKELGVDFLVSPVRHSTRNRTPGREPKAAVPQLLEMSGYAYTPNRNLSESYVVEAPGRANAGKHNTALRTSQKSKLSTPSKYADASQAQRVLDFEV